MRTKSGWLHSPPRKQSTLVQPKPSQPARRRNRLPKTFVNIWPSPRVSPVASVLHTNALARSHLAPNSTHFSNQPLFCFLCLFYCYTPDTFTSFVTELLLTDRTMTVPSFGSCLIQFKIKFLINYKKRKLTTYFSDRSSLRFFFL
jgi:hypothetical protein